MKIEQNRANLDTVGGVRQEVVRDERAATDRTAPGAAGDQVRLSTTGQLAAAAAGAAEQAPDVRSEAVARARKLLASGELGRDAERLADALIDATIGDR